MKEKDELMRHANAISDEVMLLATVLAAKIGPEIHCTAEDINAAKRLRYVVQKNVDGSIDVYREDL